MKKVFELNYLSKKFYTDYNAEDFPEIEHKMTRPYMVLLIKLDENTFAIPFRTNIRHSCCYKFKNSGRKTEAITGLDFTKAVVVNDKSYISDPATIDNKEYTELSNKYFFIIKKFKNYLEGYIDYINGNSNEFNSKKYMYSTLAYFKKELLHLKEE